MVHFPKISSFPRLIQKGLNEIRNDRNLKTRFPLWIDHPKFIPNKLFSLNPEDLDDDFDNKEFTVKSFQNLHPIKQGAILFSLPAIPPVVITAVALSAIATFVAGVATFAAITLGVIVSNIAARISLLAIVASGTVVNTAAAIIGLAAAIILPTTIGPVYLTTRAFYLEVLRVRSCQKTPDDKIVKKIHVHGSNEGKYTKANKLCNFNYLKRTQKVYYAAMIAISPFLLPIAPLGIIATPAWARIDQKLWKVPPRITINNNPPEEYFSGERTPPEGSPREDSWRSQSEDGTVEDYQSEFSDY